MTVSKPPIDITGHCSAIFNNTLYLFSPAGFQSIELKQGAKWNTLPPGTSVEGGVCVSADLTTTGNPSLYIVGGRANSTQTQFSGLQRFAYSTGQWENISPIVPVTQNRQGHGAAYLAASGDIAVYAGSQDPANTNPSSQSFLISTKAPYGVLSFTSLPPPLTLPMLMPWNATHALTVGGSADNKGLFLFGQQGWADVGTSLSQPILSRATQCTVVTGDDGSKVLQEYNLGESPNQITRYLLYGNGQLQPAGTQIGAPKASSRRRRRDLTAANWPAYNASGAPTAPRTDYSVAQGSNGLTVISGGSDTTPILLFNEKQNSWVDSGSVFGTQTQIPLSDAKTSASSTRTSATPSASSSPAAVAGKSNSHALTILGATLGAVLGLAVILALVLFCLKRKGGSRSMSRQSKRDAENEKENRLSFVDQGDGFMPAGKSGHVYTPSMNDSVTSLQIFQGQLPGHRRGQKSDSSTAGLVNHKSPLGQTEPFEMGQIPRFGHDRAQSGATEVTQMNVGNFGDHNSYAPAERVEQGRSAGWSQYFNNNTNVTDLSAVGGAAQPQTFLHDGVSDYRSSEMSVSDYNDPSARNPGQGNMKPLEINFGPKFDSNRDSNMTGAGRAISTGSGYETSHYSTWTDDRASQISNIMPVPPIGSGPAFGNAFARPNLVNTPTGNVAQAVPRPSPGAVAHSAETLNTRSSTGTAAAAQDFPMPKAYMPRSSKTEPSSPKSSRTSRGPVIRKMTGSEDMSWLNINAGRNR
jgi:hypothetical protein